MTDVFLATILVCLGTGLIAMLYDLSNDRDWEYSDAVLPLVIFPLLTASFVTAVVWVVAHTILR